MQLRRVLESVLYVDDLEAASLFYRGILGLELHSHQPGVYLFFRLDDAMLLLFDPSGSHQNSGVPQHGRGWAGPPLLRRRRGRAGPLARPAGPSRHRHRSGARVAARRPLPLFPRPAGNSLEFATPRIWGFADVTPP